MRVAGRSGRFLALGDSYTIGEGVPPEGRWTHQLADTLRQEGLALDEPLTIATTGWTTDELQAGIAAANPGGPFDLVTLLIGVNNQYRDRSLDEYAAQFEALLDQAITLAEGHRHHVLVVSIPDWGVTPFARQQGRDVADTARRIDAFNAAAQAICQGHEVDFVEITAASRVQGTDPAMLADDGLHPSALMYAHWAAEALPSARRALRA
ncbi:MAG TPA: SGNH/GDSL hydrolase family protein [Stenotrophomonas sp.]|jgi:lysophospholipase L1-like esterase